MKALSIKSRNQLEIIERNEPEAKPGEVKIQVTACGLCTWEQRVYRGEGASYPFLPGHELSGTVVSQNSSIAPGTQVAVSLLPVCGKCVACLAGRENLCAYLSPYNTATDGPGGMSEFVVVPNSAVADTTGCASEVATLVEPLACVLHSLNIAAIGSDTSLAVFGNGLMGVLHARAATALGATVVVIETGNSPLGLESAWSGEAVSSTDAEQFLRDSTRESSFDATILIRNPLEIAEMAGTVVVPGGVVSVFASLPPDRELRISSSRVRKKELVLTGAASYTRGEFAQAASFIRESKIRVDDLIYRVFDLDEAAAAFDFAISEDSARVIVKM